MNDKNKNEKEEKVYAIRPNKTQLKIETDALIKLGDELVALKPEEIIKIDLPEDLAHAIDEAKKIKSRPGLKRQRLFIGKLMRFVDYENIDLQLKKIQHEHDTNTARFKKLEQLRDKLLGNEKDAITTVINTYPNIDRQHINQLVRQALKEKQNEKPPVGARKLFKYLQEMEDELFKG